MPKSFRKQVKDLLKKIKDDRLLREELSKLLVDTIGNSDEMYNNFEQKLVQRIYIESRRGG